MNLSTIDRPAILRASAWSAELVQLRLVEAFEIEARLPQPKGNRGSTSAWPTMAREFEDLVGWSDEARQAVWADWARARGAHPYEVTRMEEAQEWLRWLTDFPGEQKCLGAWAVTRARRGSLRRLLRIKRWGRNTFYRRINDGAARIAARLNREAVAVR